MVVNNVVTYNYFNFEYQPGNDAGVVNKIFSRLRLMQDDMEWSLHEIQKGVKMLDKLFVLPELLDKLEDFGKTNYVSNTEAFRTEARKTFVTELLEQEATYKTTIKQIVDKEQARVSWQEALKLTEERPSPERWSHVALLANARLESPLFTDEQRETWKALCEKVNHIESGLLWARGFRELLPDIKRFIKETQLG